MEKINKFINEKGEKVEIETYLVDKAKVSVERVFIKNGKDIIDRLFDYFENKN